MLTPCLFLHFGKTKGAHLPKRHTNAARPGVKSLDKLPATGAYSGTYGVNASGLGVRHLAVGLGSALSSLRAEAEPYVPAPDTSKPAFSSFDHAFAFVTLRLNADKPILAPLGVNVNWAGE